MPGLPILGRGNTPNERDAPARTSLDPLLITTLAGRLGRITSSAEPTLFPTRASTRAVPCRKVRTVPF